MISLGTRAYRAIQRAVQHSRPRVAEGRRTSCRCEMLETRRLLSDGTPTVQLFDARPAVFVENQGQWPDASVRYAYNSGTASVAFGSDGLRFHLTQAAPAAEDGIAANRLVDPTPRPEAVVQSASLSMRFLGANQVTPQGEQRADAVCNYFVGDEADWRTNVPGYQAISYDNLYDGVTLKTFGQLGSMKYEFHVGPGVDYRQVQIQYTGIEALSVADDGSLHIRTSVGEMVDDAPVIYQEIAGERVAVAGRFVLLDESAYAFDISGRWDPAYELVLDPELTWSSYLGGDGIDRGDSIAMDASGNAWVTGRTEYSTWAKGGFNTSYNGGDYDAFVAKINADGTLAWSSYLGGNNYDVGYGIAVDDSGNAWVTGQTSSSGWARGGFNTSYGGGNDAFVAKVNANGTLAWSSYLGGSGYDDGLGIAIDGTANAWVTGRTESIGWTNGGFDTSFDGRSDAFVAKISADGTLAWSTYLWGSAWDAGHGIAIDGSGNAWTTGATSSSGCASGGFDTSYNGGALDAYVLKINADGMLAWSSYLGGGNNDVGCGVSVDDSGNAWVTGYTDSPDWASGGFDTSFNGRDDAFVARINADGTLAWSSYFGGTSNDYGAGIAVDGNGHAWVTGHTSSSDWTSGGFDTSFNGSEDALVAMINDDGTLAWSSYLGGSTSDLGLGIAVDVSGNAWMTGYSASSDWTSDGFDTTYNGGTCDAILAKISAEPGNQTPTDIVLAASSIAEHQPAGTTVGAFSTVDTDIGDTFTYTLVSGSGSADNGSFTISGDTLKTNAVFDYAARNSYSIRVRSTDQGGLWFEKNLTISITYLVRGCIKGTLYNDLNSDGKRGAKEVILAAQKVFLDTNNNGTLDAGEPSQISSSKGAFAFANLLPGVYHVHACPGKGWRVGGPCAGYDLAVGAGQTHSAKDFGLTQMALISGTVFNDANGNKLRGTTEVGLAGWTIFVDKDKDGVLDKGELSTRTATSGNFSLSLPAGSYTLRVLPKSGYKCTTPTGGKLAAKLTAGQTLAGRLFGFNK